VGAGSTAAEKTPHEGCPRLSLLQIRSPGGRWSPLPFLPIPQPLQPENPIPLSSRRGFPTSRCRRRPRMRLSLKRAACRPSKVRVSTGNSGERSGGICSVPCGLLRSFLGSDPPINIPSASSPYLPNLISHWHVAALLSAMRSNSKNRTNSQLAAVNLRCPYAPRGVFSAAVKAPTLDSGSSQGKKTDLYCWITAILCDALHWSEHPLKVWNLFKQKRR
jgi:hypothetical protein